MRTRISASKKPSKPYAGFPLFSHAGGQWAKKIRGRMHYFGKWSDPNAALDAYLTAKDYLIAGIKPPPDTDGARLGDVVQAFLASKQICHEDGQISARTVEEYRVECRRLLGIVGDYIRMDHLTPDIL